MTKIKFAAIGECMLELSHQDEVTLHLGYGGDTLNTAIYLARLSQALNLQVNFVSLLGQDEYSQWLLQQWQAEQLQTDLVHCIEKKLPGLYLIKTDQVGERKFYYYRSDSAAKYLFEYFSAEQLLKILQAYQYVYLSGISFAILSPADREKLLWLIKKLSQQSVKICFDTNFRSTLWTSKAEASQIYNQILPFVHYALVSFNDEQAVYGDLTPAVTYQRITALGVSEVVVKLGEQGALFFDQDLQYALPLIQGPIVDTTGAGDAFNAGYLAAKIANQSTLVAIEYANRLAAAVVQYPGAIIATAKMPQPTFY